MSNESYSKSKVVLEAVRSILVSDNVNTGNEVREIDHYCGDRIYREYTKPKKTFPQITLAIEEDISGIVLPTGGYFLEIKVHTAFDQHSPLDTKDNITARILFLLENKPASLNLATSKNLRCRLINKMSVHPTQDFIEKTYINVIRFKLICDHETFN